MAQETFSRQLLCCLGSWLGRFGSSWQQQRARSSPWQKARWKTWGVGMCKVSIRFYDLAAGTAGNDVYFVVRIRAKVLQVSGRCHVKKVWLGQRKSPCFGRLSRCQALSLKRPPATQQCQSGRASGSCSLRKAKHLHEKGLWHNAGGEMITLEEAFECCTWFQRHVHEKVLEPS